LCIYVRSGETVTYYEHQLSTTVWFTHVTGASALITFYQNKDMEPVAR
jgi:hypothetical protein